MIWPIRACLWSAWLLAVMALGSVLAPVGIASAVAQSAAVRKIAIDMRGATTPRDRMAQLSVGSDFPGTLIREDSLAQLATVQQELRFRYIRFHHLFADKLGIYRERGGKPVYDWTRIDHLYDRLLGMGLKPLVELGFTPDAMKQSDQTIFYCKGNTSHP